MVHGEKSDLLKILSKSINEINDAELAKDMDLNRKAFKDATDSFLKGRKQTLRLRVAFFVIVMTMYVLVLLGSISAVILVPIFCSGWVEILSTTIVSLASILTSILKIPNIIATHLFPNKREDGLYLNLINKYNEANGETNKKNHS